MLGTTLLPLLLALLPESSRSTKSSAPGAPTAPAREMAGAWGAPPLYRQPDAHVWSIVLKSSFTTSLDYLLLGITE